MFTSDSRYANQPVCTITLPSGAQVSAVVPVLPNPVPIAGYAQQASQGRLDLVAAQYLNAPTGFWRLCDANNSVIAAALAARGLIGIPLGGAS
jgi:hypothetical protein